MLSPRLAACETPRLLADATHVLWVLSCSVLCNQLSAWRRRPPPATRHRCFACPPPQDLQARGKDVLLPVGCSDFDEWLLDALSVDRLLKQLRSGAGTLDLINACVSTSTSAAAASRRDSLASPPRGGSALGGLEDGGGSSAVVDFRALVSGDSLAAGGGGPTLEEPDQHLPQLKLRSLQVGG